VAKVASFRESLFEPLFISQSSVGIAKVLLQIDLWWAIRHGTSDEFIENTDKGLDMVSVGARPFLQSLTVGFREVLLVLGGYIVESVAPSTGRVGLEKEVKGLDMTEADDSINSIGGGVTPSL